MKSSLSIPLLALSAFRQQEPGPTDSPDGSAPPASELRSSFGSGEVLDTTTYRQGGRDITVQQLALDPQRPVVPAVSDHGKSQIQGEAPPAPTESEPTEANSSFHLLQLSATVFPGPLTRLRWHHHGADGPRTRILGLVRTLTFIIAAASAPFEMLRARSTRCSWASVARISVMRIRPSRL